ncbi:MAG TPA: alkaline phosphatase family protein [Anaerolineales bacterium]|nr:alkaline phosphatase family protein [Anaerolineales bacterium]HNE05784.1 alkaline phosphatase family protein [Anaerolineales bacterium]HNF95234.1 alkaline phosphatase family protein [Anaerolineales bacterium]HNO94075.1 alkaline phosphatase family protein [Anaerolineales bacterium]
MSLFKKMIVIAVLLVLTGCDSFLGTSPTKIPPTSTSTPAPTALPIPKPLVPNFDHIVVFMLENEDFEGVIGNVDMPVYNKLADENILLTQYYAVGHTSLVNYIALISGETFGINTNCTDCYIDSPSLPDLIEASGRTWKTYQEDMPSPCFIGSDITYAQKHNPFIYFDPIRLDTARCEKSVVPLSMLKNDIDAGKLPNFIFITPNICNDAHDCTLGVADQWLGKQLDVLIPALDAEGPNYMIISLFEEGYGNESCCGMPENNAGGHVPAVILSPMAKSSFKDDMPYSHYSLLKTISNAWGLPYLGHAADEETSIMTSPWK